MHYVVVLVLTTGYFHHAASLQFTFKLIEHAVRQGADGHRWLRNDVTLYTNIHVGIGSHHQR